MSDNEIKQDVAVFTVCNIAYLPKALVLAESLLQQGGPKLKIVLFDKKTAFDHPADMSELLWIEDLEFERWRELAFRYDIVEYSTSLKPYIAQSLLKSYRSVVFLDPDTKLFAPLALIFEEMGTAPILLTPHHTTPQPDTEQESDLPMMRFGSFNLGFFAVNDSEEGLRFLNWWNKRCVEYSYMESQFGLSTDQKWVTIAPCFFPGLKVSFHLGFNMAAWNTFERSLSKVPAGGYRVNDRYPLVFFHFSNFDFADVQYLNKRASCEKERNYPVLTDVGREYARQLKRNMERVEKVPYAFDYMSDGAYISPTLRRAYSAVRRELPPGHDPFDAAGVVGAFARRNHLLERGNRRYVYPSMKEAGRHPGKFRWVYRGLRMILRIIGPNRFYDLPKLFVYLSAYRINRNLWRSK